MINELIEIVYTFFSTKLGVVILGVCTIIGVIGGHQLYRLLLSLWSRIKLGLSKVYHFFTFSKIPPTINARVFVNAAPEDNELAQQIISFLGEQGVKNIIRPLDFSKGPNELRQSLEKNLIDCDAVVVLYDKASLEWLKQQLSRCETIDRPPKIVVVCRPKSKFPLDIKKLRTVERFLELELDNDKSCLERFIAVLVEKVG